MARNAPGSFAVSTFSFSLLFIYTFFFFFSGFYLPPSPNSPNSLFSDSQYQLFGGSAVAKDYLFGITDYSKATWGQNFVASVAGAVASISVAAPLDTIKTRIQNANFESKVSGMTVVKELVKHEGVGALFKGLTPKVCCLFFFFCISNF